LSSGSHEFSVSGKPFHETYKNRGQIYFYKKVLPKSIVSHLYQHDSLKLYQLRKLGVRPVLILFRAKFFMFIGKGQGRIYTKDGKMK
jgi:hypothetical protein